MLSSPTHREISLVQTFMYLLIGCDYVMLCGSFVTDFFYFILLFLLTHKICYESNYVGCNVYLARTMHQNKFVVYLLSSIVSTKFLHSIRIFPLVHTVQHADDQRSLVYSQRMHELIQISILNAVHVTLNISICQMGKCKFRLLATQIKHADQCWTPVMKNTNRDLNFGKRGIRWRLLCLICLQLKFTNTDSLLDERLSLAHQLLSRYFQ